MDSFEQLVALLDDRINTFQAFLALTTRMKAEHPNPKAPFSIHDCPKVQQERYVFHCAHLQALDRQLSYVSVATLPQQLSPRFESYFQTLSTQQAPPVPHLPSDSMLRDGPAHDGAPCMRGGAGPATNTEVPDLDDDQRGSQHPLDELRPRNYHSCQTVFKMMDTLFPGKIYYTGLETSTKLVLNMPQNQRSNIILSVSLPRHLRPHANPGKIPLHDLRFTVPARDIIAFEYKVLDHTEIADNFQIPKEDRNIRNTNHELPLASLTFTTRKAYVMTAAIPQLTSQQLLDTVTSFVNTCTARSAGFENTITFSLALRHSGALTERKMVQFEERIRTESCKDPAAAWISGSPNVQAFTMGSILFADDRPRVPSQNAEIVFADRLAYQIPQVYGNCAEEEYQRAVLGEIANEQFQMVIMEMVGASNTNDNADTDHYQSQATAFLAFIDFNDKQLVRPDIGARMRVTFVPPDADTKPDQQQQVGNDNKEGHGQELSTDNREKKEKIVDENEDLRAIELGNEDKYDVLGESDGEDNDDEIITWSATVLESTDITPPGRLTVMLERPREPNFVGPREQRPFLDFPLDVVNYRRGHTELELQGLLLGGPAHSIKLQLHYSNQGFKDQVRCSDALWRSQIPSQVRISKALLAHNPQHSPLHRVNLIALKGASKLNLTTNFNSGQQIAYAHLANTPELTLLHGPYGTGKSTFMMSALLEIVSNPTANHKGLYVVDSNLAVDDIALRLQTLASANNMQKRILRGHTLVTEKTQVYKFFDAQENAQQRFLVSDQFVAEFATLAYLSKLAAEHFETKSRGDPRFILRQMSISQAMADTLNGLDAKSDIDDPRYQLKLWLQEYGQEGFANTDPERRTQIKLALNDLLAETIRSADIIVCTIAAAAKVNLATNFQPAFVCVDEASRITEFKSLIPLGLYTPHAFMFAGDHKQMRPTILSAGREKDDPPFLNPFQGQILISLFERLVLAGYSHDMLDTQHRCRGEISNWPSKAFYYGRVQKALPSEQDATLLHHARRFCHALGTQNETNRYAVAIDHSRCQKESGGTSSFNTDEVHFIIQDISLIRSNHKLAHLSIGVITFYKAQAAKLKIACHTLPGVQVIDGNEMVSPLSVKTVDAAQGAEFDIVLLSFVQDFRVGFLGEPHRLCVAMTRARFILGIYFSSALMERARTHSTLSNLFTDLQSKGHIVSRRGPSGQCLNCLEYGHQARNCPEARIETCIRCREAGDLEHTHGHRANACPYHARPPTCAHCQQAGHRRANCPRVTCSNCLATGHSAAACPVPIVCRRCGAEGHRGHECRAHPSRRTFNQHQYKSEDDDYNTEDDNQKPGNQECGNPGDNMDVDMSNNEPNQFDSCSLPQPEAPANDCGEVQPNHPAQVMHAIRTKDEGLGGATGAHRGRSNPDGGSGNVQGGNSDAW